MELPATHGTTILRAAMRKMTSFMNIIINEQIFAARNRLPRYSNISGYATVHVLRVTTLGWLMKEKDEQFCSQFWLSTVSGLPL